MSPPTLEYEPHKVRWNPVPLALCACVLLVLAALMLVNDVCHFYVFTRHIGFEWRRAFFHSDFETLRPAGTGDFKPWWFFYVEQCRLGIIGLALGVCAGAACDLWLPRLKALRIPVLFLPLYVGVLAMLFNSVGPFTWRIPWAMPITYPLLIWQLAGMFAGTLWGGRTAVRLHPLLKRSLPPS